MCTDSGNIMRLCELWPSMTFAMCRLSLPVARIRSNWISLLWLTLWHITPSHWWISMMLVTSAHVLTVYFSENYNFLMTMERLQHLYENMFDFNNRILIKRKTIFYYAFIFISWLWSHLMNAYMKLKHPICDPTRACLFYLVIKANHTPTIPMNFAFGASERCRCMGMETEKGRALKWHVFCVILFSVSISDSYLVSLSTRLKSKRFSFSDTFIIVVSVDPKPKQTFASIDRHVWRVY